MCATCGCGDTDEHHEHHHHDHEHHDHVHDERPSRIVRLEREILADNDHLAGHNREWFAARGIVALNVMGSPGAGKTSLLEGTISRLAIPDAVSVVEGDQDTRGDAERVARTGARVAQINTGAGCHLDARMVGGVLERLDPPRRSLLIVENVGNLVCPALFDLGERARVVVLSVAEGDDKPLKYPHMFRAADVLVVAKTDLLPHVDFDVERCVDDARRLNPRVRAFALSARTGDGMDAWCAWLADEMKATSAPSSRSG